MKYFIASLTGLSCIGTLVSAPVAKAEGTKTFDSAYGVNRVIRTPQGFRAFSGDYELEFSSPRNQNGEFETVQDRNDALAGRVDESVLDPELVIENRPSVYCGGRFISLRGNGSEVDVGIQLEPVTKYRTRAGWSIFFYAAYASYRNKAGNIAPPAPIRLTLNPRVYNLATRLPVGIPWRPEPGKEFSQIKGTLTLEAMLDGRARVSSTSLPSPYAMWVTEAMPNPMPPTPPPAWTVDAINQVAPRKVTDTNFYQNSSALVLFDSNRYSEGTIKRVTAMTRPNGDADPLRDGSPGIANGLNAELDGSWLKSHWSLCKVKRSVAGATAKDWGTDGNDVDDTTTGFDVPDSDVDLAFDKRYLGRKSPLSVGGSPTQFASRHIVEFDPIGTVTNETLRSRIGNRSRYQEETITINLGMVARPIGEAVR